VAQHNVSRIDGNIGAASYRNTHRCGGERRGIVNSVTNHYDLARPRKLADDRRLPIGKNACDNFTNTYTIVPTLLDIIGIDYKPGLYLGYSLFSEDINKTAFISTIGGIFNDKFFSYFGVQRKL
jgi:hypothetical protein